MATNMFRKYSEDRTEEWLVPTNTKSGTLVLEAASGRVGVTLTGSGDATTSEALPNGMTLSGIPAGGVGNKSLGATVAVDGSWLFPVAGVTAGETVQGTGTAKGTKVYRVAATGALTLTVGTAPVNDTVGRIDDCNIVGTRAAILIGA